MSLDISFKQVQEAIVASHNITHNLIFMADACGLYMPLWRPKEIGVAYAKELLPLVEHGLEYLKSDPETFKQFDAPNGWGTYESFVRFVEDVLLSCKEYPEASISAYR